MDQPIYIAAGCCVFTMQNDQIIDVDFFENTMLALAKAVMLNNPI